MDSIRRIGKCGACKQVSARDYTETTEVSVGTGMYRRQSRVFGRMVGEWFKRASEDSTCPRCGSVSWNAKRVDGFKTDEPCSAKCTSAKGFICECSCGGANHGKGWVCEAVAA